MEAGSLEFPLPRQLACNECGHALHRSLAQIPGVRGATVDLTSNRVVIQTTNEGYDYAALLSTLGRIGGGWFHDRGHPSEAVPAATAVDPPQTHLHSSEIRAMAHTNRRRLFVVLVGGLIVMSAEIVGGILSNSLVLLADAAHYATDILAVLLAFLAVSYGLRPATGQKTFGFQRVEVIAAFLQAILLWAVSVLFIWEAFERIRTPAVVDGWVLLVVGSLSLVANIGLAWILRRGSEHSINVRAAYLHILSDVLGSAAAVAAGFFIQVFGFYPADPILTIFVTILLLIFTWRLTRQTWHILMEGAPSRLDPADVESSMRDVIGVKEVHDLHIWTLTSGVDSLSAHVVLDERPTDDRVAHEIHGRIRNKYNIHHITVQVESPDCPCDTVRHRWRAA